MRRQGLQARASALQQPSAPPPAPPLLQGAAAFGGYALDAPGVRFRFSCSDVPPPYNTSSASNHPSVVPPPPGGLPLAPAGFSVLRAALSKPLAGPRKKLATPGGADLLVAETAGGALRLVRTDPATAAVSADSVFASGLSGPYGLAWFPPAAAAPAFLYVGCTAAVVRFPLSWAGGAPAAAGGAQTVVDLTRVAANPSSGHSTRDLAFSPDGSTLFIAVGSSSNDMNGAAPSSETGRADILAAAPDGSGVRVWASGIRNPAGLATHPATGALWAVVNERDDLGDNCPPDYMASVSAGQFYGWPYSYCNGTLDPRWPPSAAAAAPASSAPAVLFQAHSAPLQLHFFDGGQQFLGGSARAAGA